MKLPLIVSAVALLTLIGANRSPFDTGGEVEIDPGQSARSGRVGVFDSRALSIAYVRSAQHEKVLQRLHAELEEAESKGDRDRVAELEALGPALQARRHQQAFSTAPVDDVLDEIRPRLAEIAEQAGVDWIVSQWRIAYQADGVEVVDVTDLLVRCFDPDTETLKVLAQVSEKDPLPLYGTDWAAVEEH